MCAAAACWAFERMPQDTEPDARVSREADSRGLNPALLLAAAPERKRVIKDYLTTASWEFLYLI